MKKITTLFTMLALAATTASAQDYSTNWDGQNSTHKERYLKSVTFSPDGGTPTTIEIASAIKGACVYDKTDTKIEVAPGQKLDVSVVEYDYGAAQPETGGSWTHAYVYLDTDKNGFDITVDAASHLIGGDMKAYSFYSFTLDDDETGYDDTGATITGTARTTRALSPFAVPTEPGEYRLRVKTDWNNVNPGGSAIGQTLEQGGGKGIGGTDNGLQSFGGTIADFTIVVKEPVNPYALTLYTFTNASTERPAAGSMLSMHIGTDTDNYGENQLVVSNIQAPDEFSGYWKQETVEGQDGFKLYNVNYKKYAKTTGTANGDNKPVVAVDDAAEASFYTIFDQDSYKRLKDVGTNINLTIGGAPHCDLALWNDDETSAHWTINEVTSTTLEITDILFATRNYPVNIDLTDAKAAGLETYVITSTNGDYAIVKAFEGDVLPAGTPVVFHSEAAQTYTLNFTTEEGTAPTENILAGTLVPAEPDTDAYIFANKGNGFGLYLLDEANRTINANRAYLPVTTSNPAAALKLNFDGVSSITDVNTAVETASRWYNLQGRQVLYPAKGIFVNDKGQKVLFK